MSIIIKYTKALRIGEVLMMTGFFMIGAVFSMSSLKPNDLLLLLIIFTAIFFLIISIYSFNAFSGKQHDESNPRLNHLSRIKQPVFLIIAIVTLMVSLGLAVWLGWLIAAALVTIFCIWVLYSNPLFGLKHIPFAGTFLHFFAQILHFNVVYAIFAPLSWYSLLLSLFFALSFAAGHVHHEIIDYEADKAAGIRTGAIKLGLKRAILFCFLLFSLGVMVWPAMVVCQWVALPLAITCLAGYAVVFIAFLMLNNRMEHHEKARMIYRTVYRLVFFIEGIIFIAVRFL